MDITLTSEDKNKYLLIESKGAVHTKEDLLMHSEMVYKEIKKHNCKKILVNEPETHFPLELPHYFDLVKNYVNNVPSDIRDLKIAIIVSKEYKEVADTWETLCVSRGFQYFAFTSFNKALNWLLDDI